MKERDLNYCKSCKNRIFNPKGGLTCALKDDMEKVYGNCPDYLEDSLVRAQIERSKYEARLDAIESKKAYITVAIVAVVLLLELLLSIIFGDFKGLASLLYKGIPLALFGLGLSACYLELPFFNWRFRRAIEIFGRENTRKLTIICFACFILAILFSRFF